MSEVATVRNPFAGDQTEVRVLTGLVGVEQQRAVAEVQARMMIARANPRDPMRASDAILHECTRPTLAAAAIYSYARGGTDISGPSIRLMETIARRWGNIASGIKEISRSGEYSECVAYAWDLESGYYDERQFQVRHWRDTRSGGYRITDERDIYELIANMGQRRKRAVLQAVLPGDVIEAAVEQCEQTLTASADTSPAALQSLAKAFAEFGVTQAMIEKRIQRKLEAIRPAQVVQFRKIYASLKDEMSSPADWFEMGGDAAAPAATTAAPPPTAPMPKRETRGRKTDAERQAAQQAAPTPPTTKQPEPPVQPPQDSAGPPSGQFADDGFPGDRPSGQAAETQQGTDGGGDDEFSWVVLDEYGEPHQGVFYDDPVEWAQAFIDLHHASQNKEALVEHNADGLDEARRFSDLATEMLDRLMAEADAAAAREREAPTDDASVEAPLAAIEAVVTRGRADWQAYTAVFREAVSKVGADQLIDWCALQAPTLLKAPKSMRLTAQAIVKEYADSIGVQAPIIVGDEQPLVQQQHSTEAPARDENTKRCDTMCSELSGANTLTDLDQLARVYAPVMDRWNTDGLGHLVKRGRDTYNDRKAQLRATA